MKKLLSDSKVCTGCRSCEAICSFAHFAGETNPRKARIKVRQDLWHGLSEPVVCKQCNKPKCVQACPENAIHQDPGLKVPIIDYSKCNLCRACIEACPFGAMFYDEQDKTLLVCDLCGGDPMCVKFCRHYPHKTHAALGYMEPKEWSKIIRAPV
jgi:carbon-monoxide dehydrogenase iron sulfur subunit